MEGAIQTIGALEVGYFLHAFADDQDAGWPLGVLDGDVPSGVGSADGHAFVSEKVEVLCVRGGVLWILEDSRKRASYFGDYRE